MRGTLVTSCPSAYRLTSMNRMISLRPATTRDVDFLMELRKSTMTQHMANSGVEVTDEDHLQRVLYQYEFAEVIEMDGRRIGLLKLEKEEKFWKLVQIQLLPGLQGQGIGGALLSEIVDAAIKNDIEVSLSVLKANPARHLYKRLGFLIARESEHAYEMQFRRTIYCFDR